MTRATVERAGRTPTGVLATGTVCAAVFAGLTSYVLAGLPVTALDRRVQAFAVGHRTSWLNALLEAWTRLGSTTVLVPVLVVVSAYLWWRRRDLCAVAYLWVALGGCMVLYQVFKSVIGRARPPVAEMLTQAGGYAYPSGHATQAITTWGILAAFAVAGRSGRTRAVLLGGAGLVIVLVGVSRIYLGVHWFTDVIGGFALGATWLTLLLAVSRFRTPEYDGPEGAR
jgi:undecaprenyl-diphosphatase